MPSPTCDALVRPHLFEFNHRKDGCQRTYGGPEFWALVASYGKLIESTQTGEFALIVSRSSPDMMAVFLALIASGRRAAFFPPSSPLQDPTHYFEQQRQALSLINPHSIIVFDEETAQTIAQVSPGLQKRVIGLPRLETEPARCDGAAVLKAFRDVLFGPERVLFVQHSSGTTGIKKAVAIDNTMLLEQFEAYWPEIVRLAGECVKVATWLPLYHDMGLLAGFMLPLIAGASVSLVDPFDWIANPGSFFRLIEENGCNICWMPNFAFRHLCRLRASLPRAELSSMKAWVDCSEPCRLADASDFEATFSAFGVGMGSVVGCYAMAEAVFAVSQAIPQRRLAVALPRHLEAGQDVFSAGGHLVRENDPAEGSELRILSSGFPIAGMEVAVFAGGRRVPAGSYGEIAVRGPAVFGGYAGSTARESNLTDDGFFMTGDLGAVLDGELYVIGRIKEIIIVNGKNLHASDVESVANSLAGIKKGRVVAFGVDSSHTGSEQLVIVAEIDASAEPATLRSELNQLIVETFSISPRDIRLFSERWLVKSTSGKISRRDNKAKYLRDFRAN